MMSTEAWAFFTADSVGIIALIGKGVDGWFKTRTLLKNTKPISNGAIPHILEDLSLIKDLVISLDHRVDRLERQ